MHLPGFEVESCSKTLFNYKKYFLVSYSSYSKKHLNSPLFKIYDNI